MSIPWSTSDAGRGGDKNDSDDGGDKNDGGDGGDGGDESDNDRDVDGNSDVSSEAPSQKSSPPPVVRTPIPKRKPAQAKVASLLEAISTQRGTKRKASVMEQISEMANEDRSQRVKIVEVKQKGKTSRSRVKYTTQNELEVARLKHQERESALQRQHDLVMMDRQMELERIRSAGHPLFPPGPYHGHGPPAPGYGGPHGQLVGDPGPAYGGRPPHVIDPNLDRW